MNKEIKCSRCGRRIEEDDVYYTERIFFVIKKLCTKCCTERLLRKCAVNEIMGVVVLALMAVVALGCLVAFFVIAISM